MNTENDKGLDDLFKKKLEDPVDQTGYKEEDWAGLEKMLNKQKKRKGIIYWLPVITSAAAALLLFLGYLNFRPQVKPHHSQSKLQASRNQPNSGTNGGSNRQPVSQPQTHSIAGNYAVSPNVSKSSSTGKQYINLSSAAGSRRVIAGPNGTDANDNAVGESNVSKKSDEPLLAESPMPVFDKGQLTMLPVSTIYLSAKNADILASGTQILKDKKKIRSEAAFRPRLALSVLAAPDINGVGSFQQSKVGTNVGLVFSAGVFKKLTISTGAIYSNKPYITPFENYHTQYKFPVDPVNVMANCRMLDIPVNVGYQVFNKHQNKISIGTGLSSYIMLQQNFKYSYANAYATGPASYSVRNNSANYFGVLNLNATYERQINSKVGISLQPYLKIPMTNIGYSQVRLQTTGLAVGLTWNLNH